MFLYPDDNVIRFFWFLPTLFIIMIVFLVVVKVGYLKSNIASNIIALSLLYVISALIGGHNVGFLAIYRVGFHFFYFTLGVVFCKYESQLDQFLNSNKILTILAAVLAVALFMALFFYGNSNIAFTAPLGILCSVIFFKMATNSNPRWVKIVSLYSYQIYLLSWFPQAFILSFFKHSSLNYYWCVLASFSFGIFLPLLITFFIQVYIKNKTIKISLGL